MRCGRPAAPPCAWARLAWGQPCVQKEKKMGLDMVAYTTAEEIASGVDFEVETLTVLHYWRKHPNLHGWMEKLYREKGGSAQSFNCVNVKLVGADLDRLEADIEADRLPYTEGFFFGVSDGSERDDDLEFIHKARDALLHNMTVFYSSWW
jgi:hypothetical protein